jgi:hypothetical protein
MNESAIVLKRRRAIRKKSQAANAIFFSRGFVVTNYVLESSESRGKAI